MVHHLGREAMKRRAAAFRAAAPFTSLRLRHKDRGEALAVGALVAGVAAGFDDRVDVRSFTQSPRSDSRARERRAVNVEREHQTGPGTELMPLVAIN